MSARLFAPLLLAVSVPAAAQSASKPFEILDNSFLVEEAFNQEPRIVQNIFGATRQRDGWQLTFTQEWPAPGQRHQLSYTVSVESLAGDKARDVLKTRSSSSARPCP